MKGKQENKEEGRGRSRKAEEGGYLALGGERRRERKREKARRKGLRKRVCLRKRTAHRPNARTQRHG